MKKQMVDYSGFKFSRINEPEYKHLYLILGWVVYFALYFITENFIPAEKCHPIHCYLDDVIPFCEYFLVFYCFWFLLILGSLLYYLLFDVYSFKKLQTFIMITQAIAMFIYIVYPSRQDLRPEVFAHTNFLTDLMAFIYRFDTSTGVCPSLHVAYSMGVVSVVLKKQDVKTFWKVLLVVVVIFICLSTAFVKQHSFVDIIAALPVSLVAEYFVFGKDYWKPKFKRN